VKRGRPKWTSQVPAAELQALHDWIDSDRRYQAADIYRAQNLRRYCSTRVFRTYVQERRARLGERCEPEGSLPPSSFSQASLEELVRGAVGKALLTGDMPAYVLPNVVSALARMGQLELRREIREEARHELEQAAEKLTAGGTRALEYGEIVELVNQVMRGEAA
jgi:hypothetical protein